MGGTIEAGRRRLNRRISQKGRQRQVRTGNYSVASWSSVDGMVLGRALSSKSAQTAAILRLTKPPLGNVLITNGVPLPDGQSNSLHQSRPLLNLSFSSIYTQDHQSTCTFRF